jgi:uncharacterized protein
MPLTDLQLLSIQHNILWLTLGVTFLLGWVMNWGNFCTMGAVADIVNMGDWTRMRTWLAAMGVAIIGTHVLAGLGVIDLSKTYFTAAKVVWLSNIVGGILFGIGMVLASGCGSKTLVRIGGGSLKSLVVFIVLGLFGYMTLRGIVGVWRVALLDSVSFNLAGGQDLARVLGPSGSLARTQLLLGGLVGSALLVFALLSKEFRNRYSLVSALLIGLAIVAIWWISGRYGMVAEHPKTLEEAFLATNSGKMESLSFVAPMSYSLELLMFWSDASKQLTIGITACLGVIAGSFAYALVTKQFHWEGFRGAEDTANHLVGAALMGCGGVIAVGCTIGQGLSGMSTLAVGSIISLLAIIAGAWFGLRYQTWRVNSQI